MEVAWDFSVALESPPELSPRTLHVQNILTFQKRRLKGLLASREKVVLICACLSLAKDFYAFENHGGWRPKVDQIVARIMQGEKPRVQTIGKHLKQYLASGRHVAPSLRARLDAALRLGIKLQVAEIVGQASGHDRSLSLLLGFECARFTRMSYDSFIQLRDKLQKEGPIRESILDLSRTVNERWARACDEYHLRFGDQILIQSRELGSRADSIRSEEVGSRADSSTQDTLIYDAGYEACAQHASYQALSNPGDPSLDALLVDFTTQVFDQIQAPDMVSEQQTVRISKQSNAYACVHLVYAMLNNSVRICRAALDEEEDQFLYPVHFPCVRRRRQWQRPGNDRWHTHHKSIHAAL